MKKNETKLLASRAVNKIGNVMYDYGNSTWIAGLGSIGQKYMGYYQLAENVISLFLNPIGGAVADRFKRRQILLVTDFIGGLMCAVLAFIGNDNIMLYGLIAVNAVLGLPAEVIVTGNLIFEFFLTIFNIHFFSMVQKKVPKHMLGRVFSSIFTVAVIFMPISTAIMTALPFSISIYAFAEIGAGILLVSGGGFLYSKKVLD